ncbi:hypothetical protein [Catenuloplanes indicus]|uniref:Uncharacterized protein n=1 Tax=Catenuloplanes indicus TaxID=137267 RepID=A0AAE4B4I0_9ACTN|nr:hypothetical protein [Catenuloplanes indicus]MDQ0371448.1 hypothetical protein [Catenuloplanes indicus]
MIPSPDESGRQPRRDRTDDHRDLPPELRVVVLDDCLADACRTAQDILDLAADVRINMIDIRGGDLLERLLRRARRAGKVRALLKAAHERFPDHDDLTWLHDSMFGRSPSGAAATRATDPAPATPPGGTKAADLTPAVPQATVPAPAVPQTGTRPTTPAPTAHPVAGARKPGDPPTPGAPRTGHPAAGARQTTEPSTADSHRATGPRGAADSGAAGDRNTADSRTAEKRHAVDAGDRQAADFPVAAVRRAAPADTDHQQAARFPAARVRQAAGTAGTGTRRTGAAEARAGANAGAWVHDTGEAAGSGHDSQQMMASPQAAARVK